jgi:lipopolysaccharide/colanic/teichoic acid biosynthesis glycosyltransferase
MKYKSSKYLLLLLDVLIVVFAFLFVAKIRDGTRRILADFVWWRSLGAFVLIWIIGGILGGKYLLQKVSNGAKMVKQIVQCDLFSAAIVFGTMYIFDQFHYSRMIVLGTMLGRVGLELFFFVGLFYALKFSRENRTYAATPLVTRSQALEEAQSPAHFLQKPEGIPTLNHSSYAPPYSECAPEESILVPLWQNYLGKQEELFSFLNDYTGAQSLLPLPDPGAQFRNYFNIENEAPNSRQLFINLHRVNDFRRLNLYLIKVNELLQDGGVFICHGQTITQRRKRFHKKFTPVLGAPLYFGDFLLRRVMPKLPVLQGWYFALTKGKNRALAETEMLGRFYFCGFELIHKREVAGHMHFILKKSRPPRTDPNPTYGPLIRLKRLGQSGRTIYVKKLRTMHPYSEYLQDYVYQANALQEGGKFKNDFRVTSWGRILRALWIDELPQLLNFFKGDLALVGVRALSEHYFSLYPPDMQELRLQLKPGLMPPFYTDLPQTFDEIVESERRYILAKQAKPFSTDWKYFWRGVWNILFNRARSN